MSVTKIAYDKKHNAMQTIMQNQYSDIVDYYFCRQIQFLELAQAAVMDEMTITITDAAAVTVGNYVCIQESSRAFQAKILSKLGNVLTLDTPIDYPFTTEASIAERNPKGNLNGSVTPQILTIAPAPGAVWDITGFTFSMVHAAEADDGKFGGIAALTKGIVIRFTDGIHHTIFNAKTNGDLKLRKCNVVYSNKAPAGQYGTSGYREFESSQTNEVVVRLNGDLGEKLEVLIQDDLTGLIDLKFVALGHLVE